MSTLCHHGIKGQKWGVRRFQRKDGTLTNAGKKRVQKAESDPLPGHAKNKKIKDRKQADAAYSAGKKEASKVDADTRKSLLDSYWDMLNKDPEHYWPDEDYEDEESYERAIAPYRRETEAAETKYISLMKDAASKYLGVTVREHDAMRYGTYYDQLLVSGFMSGLEDLEYEESLHHSQIVSSGKAFCDARREYHIL